MTIAFLVNPALCPVQPMHIRVDERGFTRPDPVPPNAPNAQVCQDSNPDAFFRFLLPRLAAP
jgi:purine nucleosidase